MSTGSNFLARVPAKYMLTIPSGGRPFKGACNNGRVPINTYPIRRLSEDHSNVLDRRQWPAVLPAVAAILEDGLDLTPATIFVGENGTGKSTLVEAIALAYGSGGVIEIAASPDTLQKIQETLDSTHP